MDKKLSNPLVTIENGRLTDDTLMRSAATGISVLNVNYERQMDHSAAIVDTFVVFAGSPSKTPRLVKNQESFRGLLSSRRNCFQIGRAHV